MHFSLQMHNMQYTLLLHQNLLKYHQMMAKICLYEFVQVLYFYKILIPIIISILNKHFIYKIKNIQYYITLSKSKPASSFYH